MLGCYLDLNQAQIIASGAPSARSLDRPLPVGVKPFARDGVHRRSELSIELPVAAQVFAIRPIPDGQSREVRRSQRGRLLHDRTTYASGQQVRLNLHQQIVVRGTAVHLEFRQWDS